ncbi:uncharacterized protein EDB91DRAFT_1153313 [Suillus paluster]|uniref:uncharacterized protein n=1 Tax=Suillus paluster TaxID=48578 RepID=UPI001B881136|nr:uncharacterized protein EDB91DRAFT_1153313 [Suillus paluster]KAG1731836.1 hypothetical protein EDB91DRAFT_1153313 [Suillus paluster]
MMFTSRSMVFVLLGFLAGANACVSCPSTLKVDSSVVNLYLRDPIAHIQTTFCEYRPSDGSHAFCIYNTVNGQLKNGYKQKDQITVTIQSCPHTETLKDGNVC